MRDGFRPRRRMRPWTPALALVVVLATGAAFVLTASNAVPVSRAEDNVRTITANDLKPPECDGITLSGRPVTGNGGNGNDLVLGTANGDNLAGGNGDDCVVGGGGMDRINGGGGTRDVCLGGAGLDLFSNCETQIQ